MATVSLGAMLKQMSVMVGGRDLSDWEQRFLKGVLASTANGARTSILTGDQAEKVEQIWEKHFRG